MERPSQTLAPTHHHKRLRQWLRIRNDTCIAINSKRVQKCKFAQRPLRALFALCHFGLVLQWSSGEQMSYKSSPRPGQVFFFRLLWSIKTVLIMSAALLAYILVNFHPHLPHSRRCYPHTGSRQNQINMTQSSKGEHQACSAVAGEGVVAL